MSLHNRASLEPWISDDITYYQHQVEGVRRMARMRSVLLADDMGLGKSLQTLTVYALDVKRNLGNKLLVVCPASLKANWVEEITKFMGNSIHVTMLGSKLNANQRDRLLDEFAQVTRPKILIVNYEQVIKHGVQINKMLFDIVAFDEAHMLKNPKAKRTVASQRILAKRAILMTGSPILNQVNELYPLLQRIGVENLPTYYSFINRFCVFGGWNGKSITGTKNESQLIKLLDEYMIRRRKEDVLDLPPVQYITRFVEMHPLQKKYYDQIVRDMRLTNSAGDETEIKNAMTKFLRLKQICGTTACMPGEEQDVSHKLDQACDDAYEIMESGHRVVAFTQFRDVQDAFISRLQRHNTRQMGPAANHTNKKPQPPLFVLNGDVPIDERQAIIRAWSMSNVPGILIAMFQVAGVGLNMTAARHGLFLDKQFVPALNQQAVDRMHRIGADDKQSVQIIEYYVKGTVEARVEKILATKKKVFNNIVEDDSYLRKLIEELMKEEANGGN